MDTPLVLQEEVVVVVTKMLEQFPSGKRGIDARVLCDVIRQILQCGVNQLAAVVEREESGHLLPPKIEAKLYGVSAPQNGPRILCLVVIAEADSGQVRAQPDRRPSGRTLASR